MRGSQGKPRFGAKLAKGSVFTIRADLMTPPARDLVQAAAPVVLWAVHGSVADQLARIVEPSPRMTAPCSAERLFDKPLPDNSDFAREFFDGTGGFEQDGQEYGIELRGNAITPAPWINVIANPRSGFQVSADGSGYTWSENRKENKLTPWSNDLVMDPCGETLFLCDEASGELWMPSALPIRRPTAYRMRHGFRYSVFERCHADIASTPVQYVALCRAHKDFPARAR